MLAEMIFPHLQHVKDVSMSHSECALFDLFVIGKVLSVKLEKRIYSRAVTVACVAATNAFLAKMQKRFESLIYAAQRPSQLRPGFLATRISH